MQEPVHSRRHISDTFIHARERFRQLRRSLSTSFRKPSYTSEIVPSPFVDRPTHRGERNPDLRKKPSKLMSREPSMSSEEGDVVMDGVVEHSLKRSGTASTAPHVSAIFIHAGAGYHSSTNEHIHLQACNDAARLAMQTLRSGGSALDAVEIAVKVLEDKEITNAGYGSNLSIDGVVECDATIVDHLGRSGACGAVAQIKNPINLARMILELSTKPLSLRRVPPNLLVGQGATDFAWEHGISVVPHDMVVSKNARDRYLRWREDLRRADGRMTPATSTSSSQLGEEDPLDVGYEERVRKQQRRDHVQALLNGTWNEGQPDSPGPMSPGREISGQETPTRRYSPTPSSSAVTRTPGPGQSTVKDFSTSHFSSPSKRPRRSSPQNISAHPFSPSLLKSNIIHNSTNLLIAADGTTSQSKKISDSDGASSPIRGSSQNQVGQDHSSQKLPPAEPRRLGMSKKEEDEDMITDTVGAIAIDMYGHIASASSSGGIGMKHRGRVGPAALVGVGSVVIPADDNDPNGTAVAAVTSGTGEHMATTMASQKCAERLYHNTKRGRGGGNIDATEEEALESFIQADFMGHPGVKDSISAGAIGVMAVKKSPYGYFLHFAHNTDSFALASMHSNEKDPKCVMSRIGEQGSTVQGGRKIRID